MVVYMDPLGIKDFRLTAQVWGSRCFRFWLRKNANTKWIGRGSNTCKNLQASPLH